MRHLEQLALGINMTLPPDIERVALLGWHVYPCSTRTKAGCFKNATDAATCDLDQLEQWSRQYPKCNWRVVLGPSQLWGLDCDAPPLHAHDGVSALTELVKVHGPLPPRPTMRSGGGGIGVFFRHNGERIIGNSGCPAPGIDPRRARQSQTIPPSRHIVTGNAYRWAVAPWEVSAPTAPVWLLKLVEPPPEHVPVHRVIDTTDAARVKLYRAVQEVAQAGAGSRNDTLNRRAYQVGRMLAAGLLAEQEAIEALYGAARAAGLDHNEAKGTIRSGINSGLRRGASGR